MLMGFRKLKYCITILWLASKRFYSENYTYQASALTFVTLMSVVPIFSLILYLVSVFPVFSDLVDTIQKYIYANLIPSSSEVLVQYLNKFIYQATRLPTSSIIFSVVTTLTMIIMIETILNQIWNANKETASLKKRVETWVILLFTPLLIGITSSLTEFIYQFTWINQFQNSLIILFNILINAMIFSIIYRVTPNKIISWKLAILGGLTTAILFEISKKIFSYYIMYFTSYEFIYGTLSTIPIFLIWLYFAWCIFLFGALVMQAKDSLDQ